MVLIFVLLLFVGFTGSFAKGRPAKSLKTLLSTCAWQKTNYGFSVPNIMKGGKEVFVEDMPSSVMTWKYKDVSLSFWGLIGFWAVTDYPDVGMILSENEVIRNVTYRYGDIPTGVFSGYTKSGKIWYLKKHLVKGFVSHSQVFVLVYPPKRQKDVRRLINEVKNW